MINAAEIERQMSEARVVLQGKDAPDFIGVTYDQRIPQAVFPTVPHPEVRRRIGSRDVVIGITPVEVVDGVARHPLARAVRFDLRRDDCCPTTRTINFREPVRVTEEGVYVQSPRVKGAQRFKSRWAYFDPAVVFSGKPEDIKIVKNVSASKQHLTT